MMSRLSVIFFIIISSVLIHTDSSDVIYSAVLPHTVTALTGSCVQIPCTFNISNFKNKLQRKKNIYGVWLKRLPQFDKSESLVVFNGSQNLITGFSHIELIGNVTESNCTTIFYNIMKNHTDPYYFRLQMEPDVFRATFNSYDSSKTVRITVTDSPQLPELKSSPMEVMEGTAVNLTCSAEAPCPKQPPTLSWSYIPKSANITTQLQEKPDKTQSVFSRMTFIVSYMDHRQNISCTVAYPRNISNNTTVERTRMLQVQFSPKETHIIIDPSALVSVGTNVTLTCKSKGSPSTGMNFTWYKQGQETPIAWTETMTFSVIQNDIGWYFCRAQNKIGNQSSDEIQLTVKETQVIIDPSASVFVGTNVTLTCKSKGSPSTGMNFTWYKRGQETPIAWTKKITFNVTQNNTGWYFCRAQNKIGNQSSEEIQLTVKEHNGPSESVIYGCTGGLLALLVLSAVFCYCVRTRASSQTSVREKDQTENKEMLEIYCNNPIVIKKSEISEQEADELHYGEIDFTHHTNQMTRRDSAETEYAEVQRSERKRQNNVQQQEEIYAQVRK